MFAASLLLQCLFIFSYLHGIHPTTQDLHGTVAERYLLGDDPVPDFFTRIQQNDFFGWPFAYLSSDLTDPRRRLPDGTSERPDLVALKLQKCPMFSFHLI